MGFGRDIHTIPTRNGTRYTQINLDYSNYMYTYMYMYLEPHKDVRLIESSDNKRCLDNQGFRIIELWIIKIARKFTCALSCLLYVTAPFLLVQFEWLCLGAVLLVNALSSSS